MLALTLQLCWGVCLALRFRDGVLGPHNCRRHANAIAMAAARRPGHVPLASAHPEHPERRREPRAEQVEQHVRVARQVRRPLAAPPAAAALPAERLAARVRRERVDARREVARRAVAEDAVVREVAAEHLADAAVVGERLHGCARTLWQGSDVSIGVVKRANLAVGP
jgi:hypothetical protein